MTYDSGVARAAYLLDISQPRQAAAELRALFQGIRESTAAAPQTVLAPPTEGVQAYVASLREAASATAAAASPTQSLIESIRAEGAALGQTDEQISAHLAALSREALAIGDVTRALELESAALGETGAQEGSGTAQTLQRAAAEARAAIAAKDYGGALRGLASELQQQGERTVDVINAERQLIQIENQATRAAEQEAAAITRAADARIRVAQADARALAAKKDYGGALSTLNVATAAESEASANVLATVGAQAAQYEVAGTAAGAFGAQLGALLNPMVLITAAAGAGIGVVKSFGDALQFAGALQEERTAFGGILGDFKNGNAVLDEATQRTRAYGFTAKETTDAFRQLAPVIRESTSTTKDQAEALARIAVLKPDDPVKALTSAIEGIKTGRFRELSKELGLTAAEQKQLKTAVDNGKDAFIALNDVLDRHGITLQVAKERTDGLAGAERRQAQASEDLAKAQARFAEGPGLALLNQRIKATNDATDAFGGSIIGLNNVINDTVGLFNPLLGAITSYNNFVLNAGRNGLVWAGIIQETTPVVQSNTSANQANGAAIDQAAQQAQQANAAQRAYADSLELTGVRARAAQQAAEQKSATDKVAALDAQTHGIAEQHLADQAKAAADALIKAGPAGARTAALLASSSSSVDVLTAAYYRLALAQQSTNKGATQQDAANFRSTELFGQTAGQTTAALQKQTAADLARSQGIIQNGTALQKIAELQRLYNDAVRQSGANSAQAITAQNALTAAQIAASKEGGHTRVSAAASTGLQLQNVEENTQAQLLKTQREGLERLRDQEQDFDLKRSRSKEDEDEKIRGLLARGQRAEAAREQADFAKKTRRDQEDFTIQRQRTIRNNDESTGDISGAAERRTGQIDARAALRGVRPTGGGVGAAPNLPSLPTAAAAPQASAATLTIQGVIMLDSKAVGTGVWPTIQVLVDNDLSVSLQQIGAPGSGQSAVAGAG